MLFFFDPAFSKFSHPQKHLLHLQKMTVSPRKNRKTSRVEYSPQKRARIIIKYGMGATAKTVGRAEGLSAGVVRGVVRRYKHQDRGRSLKRIGRPRKIFPRDKRHILRLINLDPFISNMALLAATGLTVNIRTITRFLQNKRIQHHVALRRPKLSDIHAQKRLEFALKYVDKPQEWWHGVVFSDESSIQRGQGEKTKWVFCRRVRILPPLLPPTF